MELSNHYISPGNDCCGPHGTFTLNVIKSFLFCSNLFAIVCPCIYFAFMPSLIYFLEILSHLGELTYVTELSGCNGHFGYPTKCSLSCKSHNVNRDRC